MSRPALGPASPAPSASSERVLLYVVSEHPSLSQTFVVTEADAVCKLGQPVLGYGLRIGSATSAAAPFTLVTSPPSAWTLAQRLLRNPRASARVLRMALRAKASLSELVRLLVAEAHAIYVTPHANAAGVTHIHAHFLGRTSDVAQALAARLGCNWTATAHGADAYAPREPALQRQRLASVQAVACANARVAGAVLTAGPGHIRTEIVHCGVDSQRLVFSSHTATRLGRCIVTVARLVPTKGHRTILDSASQFLRDHPEHTWTVIGDGPLGHELRSDARTVALRGRLAFVGPKTHLDVLAAVAKATAFVLPCEVSPSGGSDGIPVAIMEAMALGVPVITTQVGGIPELVEDGITGFVCPPRDPKALIAVLESVLFDLSAHDLLRVTRRARERIEEGFDTRREAIKLLRFLNDVTAAAQPAPRQCR